MRLDIEFINGQSHSVNGMYTIDEEKLKALSSDNISELHRLDYLSYIYAMIASMGQLYALVQRKNSQLSENSQLSKNNESNLKSA
jgi:hypothetical protein